MVSILFLQCLSVLILYTDNVILSHLDSNGCHEGSFLCSQSGICIANKYKCNNHSDCQQGEDEDSLLCS